MEILQLKIFLESRKETFERIQEHALEEVLAEEKE
jgi:hypothetical protein